MTCRAALISCCTLSLCGGIWAHGDADAPKAKARQALATRALAQEARALLSTWAAPDEDTPEWIDPLTRAMLDDPAPFQSKNEGRTRALHWIKERRNNQFTTQIEAAHQRASDQSPLPVSLPQALNQADPDWEQRRTEASRQFAESWVPRIYEPARQQAVERQRTRLTAQQHYPTFDVLDPLIADLDRSRQSRLTPLDAAHFQVLDAELQPYLVTTDEPLFDEIHSWLDEVVTAMRLTIFQQYRDQLDLLKPFWKEGQFPATAPVRAALQAAMETYLQQTLDADPDAIPPVYPVFTAVNAFIADAAAYWETQAFHDFLTRSESKWQPDFKAVNALLAETPSRDYRVLTDHWIDHIGQDVAAAYARAVEEAGHGSWRADFNSAQETDGWIHIAFKDFVRPSWQQALNALEQQLALVRAVEQDEKDRLRADVLRGVNVDRILRSWTRTWERRWAAESETVAPEWQAMFDPTRDLLNKTVRQWYTTVEANAAAEPDAQAAADREADPESDQPASEAMTPIDRPMDIPGETAQETAPEEDGEGEGVEADEAGMTDSFRTYRGIADGVFWFTDLPDGRAQLHFGTPDQASTSQVVFDPSDVVTAAAEIAAALRAPLRAALDAAAQDQHNRRGFLFFARERPAELRMLFRVGSTTIRHQMSILVRQHLDDEIQRWSEETGHPAPNLSWQEEALPPD